MNHVLAAIDFSEVTPRVVALAAELARAQQCEVTLLHVAAPDPDFVGYDVGPQSVRDTRAHELRDENREIGRLADQLRERGLRARGLLIQGPSAEKILAEAARLPADLLVLGAHRHGALARVFLGSVVQDVLRQAACPVVVVPARPLSESGR